MSEWPLSNLTLVFNKSSAYRRVLICLLGITLWMFIQSSCVLWLKCIGVLVLLGYGVRLIYHATPTGVATLLCYQGGKWRYGAVDEVYWDIEKIRVCFNMGYFFVLQLSSTTRQVWLVVFFDQLSEDERRKLMWLTHE